MKIIKKQIHDKKARIKMMEGVDQLADVVGSTMGACGRNVIVDNEYGSPLVVNDGATIANEIFFDDHVKNSAVQLVKDAANRTNAIAGDGTTTTTVLSRAIIKAGWKAVDAGANPVALRKQLIKAIEDISKNLDEQSSKIETVEELIQIAQVSVQDEELGELIGKLMFALGKDGAVAIKSSLEPGVFVEKDAGMRIEGAVQAGVVSNEAKRESVLNDAKVLILKDSPEDHELESKWVPFFQKLMDVTPLADGKMRIDKIHVPSLLVIAEKLSHRFIMTMNQNNDRVKWTWFRPSTAGKNMPEIYKDISSLVGGKIVDEEEGVYISQLTVKELGEVNTAVAGRFELVLTVDEEKLKSNEYLDRINAVEGQINSTEEAIEKEETKVRYANLTGGVAAIKVSAATDQDTVELKLRIEDAINASRAAMEDGYVAGGGVALYNAAKNETTIGEKVLKEACKASITQILYNAGYEDIDKLIAKLKEGEGINVLTEKTVNMKEEGIVDPLKVVKQALINSVSVAGLLLTSEYVVTNEEDDHAAVKKFFTKD